MAIGKVYGNPVLPLSAQPPGSKLTTKQRAANALFIAWYLYTNVNVSYEWTIGFNSALMQESELDPTQFTPAGPALGLPQLVPPSRWYNVFRNFGYTIQDDWVIIERNMYCQVKYLAARFTNPHNWYLPANISACDPPWIIQAYEQTMNEFLTSTYPNSVAGCVPVMSLHPGEVNSIYRDYRDGKIDHDTAVQQLEGIVHWYQRAIPAIRSWYTEDDIKNYIPPPDIRPMKFIYYLKPFYLRNRRLR